MRRGLHLVFHPDVSQKGQDGIQKVIDRKISYGQLFKGMVGGLLLYCTIRWLSPSSWLAVGVVVLTACIAVGMIDLRWRFRLRHLLRKGVAVWINPSLYGMRLVQLARIDSSVDEEYQAGLRKQLYFALREMMRCEEIIRKDDETRGNSPSSQASGQARNDYSERWLFIMKAIDEHDRTMPNP